jgi:dienelactone hydrolase
VRHTRLAVAAVLITLVVAGAALAATLAAGTRTGRGDKSTTTTTTTIATSSTTTAPPPMTPIGTYTVETTSLTVTVAGLPPTDNVLPTTVWYPASTSATGDHRAAHRRYPLLVFSEGYAQPVSAYAALIADWASAGFVVAGPTYPHTAPSTPTTLDRAPSELGRHPTDLRAVITTLLDAGRTRGSVLAGKIDPSEVGLVGQSDGGDVSLAVADSSCCRYAGVKAAAILSGAEYRYFGGQYFAPGTPPGPPLLVVQGTDDTVNPPVCSAQIYDAAAPPKYYLDLLGATHLAPYEDATSWQAVVAQVTTDFFDADLAGERGALTRMYHDGNVADVAQLITAPTSPPATGSCPTAPATTAPPATTTTTTAPPATTTTTTAAPATTTTTTAAPATTTTTTAAPAS